MIRGGPAFSHAALLAAIALSLASGSSVEEARAQLRDCTASGPTTVFLDILEAPLASVNENRSLGELRSMVFRDGRIEPSGLVLGHYVARARYRYTVNAEGRRLPSGGLCVLVGGLTVRFGIADRSVFVAREVLDYPCLRKAVVAHENLHVAADDAVLQRFVVYLRSALELEYGTGIAIRSSTQSESQSALKTILETRLDMAIEEFEHHRQLVHGEIDDANLEAAMITRCGAEAESWFKRYR